MKSLGGIVYIVLCPLSCESQVNAQNVKCESVNTAQAKDISSSLNDDHYGAARIVITSSETKSFDILHSACNITSASGSCSTLYPTSSSNTLLLPGEPIAEDTNTVYIITPTPLLLKHDALNYVFLDETKFTQVYYSLKRDMVAICPFRMYKRMLDVICIDHQSFHKILGKIKRALEDLEATPLLPNTNSIDKPNYQAEIPQQTLLDVLRCVPGCVVCDNNNGVCMGTNCMCETRSSIKERLLKYAEKSSTNMKALSQQRNIILSKYQKAMEDINNALENYLSMCIPYIDACIQAYVTNKYTQNAETYLNFENSNIQNNTSVVLYSDVQISEQNLSTTINKHVSILDTLKIIQNLYKKVKNEFYHINAVCRFKELYEECKHECVRRQKIEKAISYLSSSMNKSLNKIFIHENLYRKRFLDVYRKHLTTSLAKHFNLTSFLHPSILYTNSHTNINTQNNYGYNNNNNNNNNNMDDNILDNDIDELIKTLNSEEQQECATVVKSAKNLSQVMKSLDSLATKNDESNATITSLTETNGKLQLEIERLKKQNEFYKKEAIIANTKLEESQTQLMIYEQRLDDLLNIDYKDWEMIDNKNIIKSDNNTNRNKKHISTLHKHNNNHNNNNIDTNTDTNPYLMHQYHTHKRNSALSLLCRTSDDSEEIDSYFKQDNHHNNRSTSLPIAHTHTHIQPNTSTSPNTQTHNIRRKSSSSTTASKNNAPKIEPDINVDINEQLDEDGGCQK